MKQQFAILIGLTALVVSAQPSFSFAGEKKSEDQSVLDARHPAATVEQKAGREELPRDDRAGPQSDPTTEKAERLGRRYRGHHEYR